MRNSFEKVLELIFVKCIFEFMINTAPPPSNSVYGREKLFWYDKITFWTHVFHCSAVVKMLFWMCRQTGFVSRRRCFLFLCIVFFFLFGLFFLTLFFLLYSYCLPCWSCTWINIYFKLKSGVFCKRDFKSSSSVYLMAKLTTRKKTISCQDMSLLWNSWIFFNVSWHHDKQHTVHHKLY